MHYYLSPWVGTGIEDAGGAFCPPTGQQFSVIDWRPDSTVPDGWCLVAVAQRDEDLGRAGGVWLGDDLDDRVAGGVLLRRFGLNPKLGDRLSLRDAVADLFFSHATPVKDRTRWNGLGPTVGWRPRFEAWLGGERILDLPVVSGGATYTDDFNTADTLTFGADLTWTEIGSLEIYSNEAAATTSGGSIQRARAEHDCATSNNYAQVTLTLHINLSTDFYAAACRYASAATTAYEALQGNGSATTGTVLRKVVTGTTTSLSTGTNSWALNDVLRCEASGSTISHKINGTTHLSVTDTSITTGTRGGLGIKSFSPTTLRIDNFEMGDLATPSAPSSRRQRR